MTSIAPASREIVHWLGNDAPAAALFSQIYSEAEQELMRSRPSAAQALLKINYTPILRADSLSEALARILAHGLSGGHEQSQTALFRIFLDLYKSLPNLIASAEEDFGIVRPKDAAARLVSLSSVLTDHQGYQIGRIWDLNSAIWNSGDVALANRVTRLMFDHYHAEIHGGAKRGRRLFIDHANGLVVGATAIVGDDVSLFQGVTLGATKTHDGKRHPTLENDVVVATGGGAFGNIALSEGVRIGPGAVVKTDIPAGHKVELPDLEPRPRMGWRSPAVTNAAAPT